MEPLKLKMRSDTHAGVVESAVVGYPHDIKGQGIYAYVIYNGKHGDEKYETTWIFDKL